MALVTLEEAKAYLKIEIDDDDTMLSMQLQAAETYLTGATGQNYSPETDVLAKLYCLMLIQHLYDNRTLVITGNESLSTTASAIMLQLQCQVDETL